MSFMGSTLYDVYHLYNGWFTPSYRYRSRWVFLQNLIFSPNFALMVPWSIHYIFRNMKREHEPERLVWTHPERFLTTPLFNVENYYTELWKWSSIIRCLLTKTLQDTFDSVKFTLYLINITVVSYFAVHIIHRFYPL